MIAGYMASEDHRNIEINSRTISFWQEFINVKW